MYNVRRSVLDNLLVEAAVEAGVEFRPGCSVDEIIVEGSVCRGIRGHVIGGEWFEARAPIVVGADGRHSRVAAAMPVEEYLTAPALTYTYYSYFSGLDLDGRMEVIDRAPYTIVAQPTSHGRSMVGVLGPASEFHEFRKDIETNFDRIVALAPEFHARWQKARRDERFVGTVDVQNIVRVPYGPGFALVGDAGLHQDPTLGQGITNAFRDAEFLATAIDRGLSGDESMTDALRAYHERRDAAVLPMHELVKSIASHEPPSPEVEAAFGALPGNQRQIDRFFGVMLGTVRVEDFFSPENLASIVEEAATRERELVAA
jgi:flavin-dependent dehydrogenase